MPDPAKLQAVFDAAQAALGTRYVANQRRLRSAASEGGVDCIWCVGEIGLAAGVLEIDPDLLADFTPYPPVPRNRDIVRAADAFLVERRGRSGARVLHPRPGQVALYNCGPLPFRRGLQRYLPSHFGVMMPDENLIHANPLAGKVVASPPRPHWRPYGVWDYPGLANN